MAIILAGMAKCGVNKAIFIVCYVLSFCDAIKAIPSDDGGESKKLEVVQVLFRHGERTPLKDEYSVLNYTDLTLYEPYGLEQLTNRGKNQAYDVGLMLRQRYHDFLNPVYDPYEEVYSYTSDNVRTKLSLQLLLSGLYPPTEEITWNKGLKWLPIPFRYVPQRLDVMLNLEKNPKYLQLLREMFKSLEYEEFFSTYSEFFDFVRDRSGADLRKNDVSFFYAYNVLFINERLNLPLPDWYDGEVKQTYTKLYRHIFDILTFTRKMKRLYGGTIVKRILRNAMMNDSRKLYLYSAHDLNIGTVLRVFGVADVEFIDFAGALIFEIYRDSEDRQFIKLMYWDATGETMKTLKLDACDELCHVDNFTKIIHDVIPLDEETNELLSATDLKQLENYHKRSHCW